MKLGVYGNRLIASMVPGDLALLDRHLDRVVLNHQQILTRPGEAVADVFFPEHPTVVALFMPMDGGRLVQVAGADGTGVVGLTEAMADGSCLTRAVVFQPGPALRISAKALRGVLSRSKGLQSLAARHSEALTGQAMRNAACNAVHTLEKRIARWLLASHDVARGAADADTDDRILLPVTQEMMSDIVGAQRTTVTHILGDLDAAGMIRQGRGRIFIADRARLQSAACDCNEAIMVEYRRLFGPEIPEGQGG